VLESDGDGSVLCRYGLGQRRFVKRSRLFLDLFGPGFGGVLRVRTLAVRLHRKQPLFVFGARLAIEAPVHKSRK
jgi:hypothetical protein